MDVGGWLIFREESGEPHQWAYRGWRSGGLENRVVMTRNLAMHPTVIARGPAYFRSCVIVGTFCSKTWSLRVDASTRRNCVVLVSMKSRDEQKKLTVV